MIRRFLHLLILLILIISFSFGCSIMQGLKGAGQEDTGYWELTWADPQIISSESTHTLIYASRVDSFYVDRPGTSSRLQDNNFSFEIRQPICRVSINLHDFSGNFLTPLFSESLKLGYYKFSFHPENIKNDQINQRSYQVRVDVCGKSSRHTFLGQ